MADNLLDEKSTVKCPHGAKVTITCRKPRVKVDGQPVALLNDTFAVSGCNFFIVVKPQPCTRVTWGKPATRLRIDGKEVLLETSSGQGKSAEQSPQGPASVKSRQTRVKGT